MKCITVSIEKIKKDNPRLCLSPLRYLGHCYKCPQFVGASGKPCNSRIISPEAKKFFALEKKKEKLKNLIKRVEEEQEGKAKKFD